MTAWDVSTAVYDNISISVNSQDTTPNGVFFSEDGTTMYIAGDTNNRIYQYTLTTPWDLSTASYANKNKLVDEGGGENMDLYIGNSGTRMYISDGGYDVITQYNLSTPWDVSTASYAAKYFNIQSQSEYLPEGLFLNPDGTKLYVLGDSTNSVLQYTLSTAWDVSTASYVGSMGVGGQDGTPTGMFIKSDGATLYVVGDTNNTIYQYTLSTPWLASTGTYTGKSVSVNSEDATPEGVHFKSDGTKMYMVGNTNNTVYQYSLPGEEPPPSIVTRMIYETDGFNYTVYNT